MNRFPPSQSRRHSNSTQPRALFLAEAPFAPAALPEMSQKPQQRSRSPAVAPAELRVSQARAPSSPTPAGSRSGAPRDSAERSSEALLDASDRGASGASSAAQTGRRSARDRRPVEEIGVDVQVKGEEISDGGTDASATADEPLFDKMSEVILICASTRFFAFINSLADHSTPDHSTPSAHRSARPNARSRSRKSSRRSKTRKRSRSIWLGKRRGNRSRCVAGCDR